MNEKLKEIAIKAQVEHCISHVRLQEFAELIIKECAEKIAHNEKFNWLDAAQAAKDLKEHFGVEE